MAHAVLLLAQAVRYGLHAGAAVGGGAHVLRPTVSSSGGRSRVLAIGNKTDGKGTCATGRGGGGNYQ